MLPSDRQLQGIVLIVIIKPPQNTPFGGKLLLRLWFNF